MYCNTLLLHKFMQLLQNILHFCVALSLIYCLLQEFVSHDNWMHLDIAGVMMNKTEVPYVPKGMSGKTNDQLEIKKRVLVSGQLGFLSPSPTPSIS